MCKQLIWAEYRLVYWDEGTNVPPNETVSCDKEYIDVLANAARLAGYDNVLVEMREYTGWEEV